MSTVRTQIDHLQRQAEAATETANGLQDQMDAISRRLTSLRTDVTAATTNVDQLRASIGDFAAAQYRAGGTGVTIALLTSTAPADFLDQMTVSESVDAQQTQALVDLRAQQKVLTEKKLAEKSELVRLADAKAKTAENRAAANGKLADQKALLQRLTAAEKARLAALERARQARIAEQVARASRDNARTALADNTTKTDNRTNTNSTETTKTDTTKPGKTDSGSSSGQSKTEPAPSNPAGSSRAQIALAYARAQLGKPYVFGAAGPNAFDCSGLTMMAWRAAGVSLPHLVSAQYNAVPRKVSISELKPGDLVMFYNMGHVGIYAGNGLVIHAPRPGVPVQYLPMKYMPFAGAVRPG